MQQAATATAAPAGAPLPDVMLAMDVVDTLRHAQAQVARELSETDRAAELKRRLREIYAAQGIDVPERILEEGVKGISEARFRYAPTPPSWQRTVAGLWVTRARWGLAALAGIGVVVVGALVFQIGVRAPEQRRVAAERTELAEGIPQGAAAARARIAATGAGAAVLADADRLVAQANAAARAGDLAAARTHLAELNTKAIEVARTFRVRIVQAEGQPSGIWRVPRANPRGQNFYLIVEGIDAQNRPVPVRVTSEETRETREVTRWGLRVPQSVFEAVRRDKTDDGIIQNDIVGEKRAGEMAPRFSVETTGAAILTW
jgi:hypothetical protein